MLTRPQLERFLSKYEPLVRRAMFRVIEDMVDRANLSRLIEEIQRGNLDEALLQAGWRDGQWTPMTETIRETFINAGEATAGAAPKKARFVFNVSDPRAEEWLRRNSSRLVTRINAEQRETIRIMLTEGLQRGRNPRQTALDLVGRMNRSTRSRRGGVIGLTSAQARWVSNMRGELRSGDPLLMQRYFGRELRDRRFDKIVARAMREGRPVSAGDVSRIVQRYSDRMLKYRGDVIARTETLQAASAARDEALAQAVDQGLIREDKVTKIWRTASDSRVRDSHDGMDGQERPQGLPFLTDSGSSLMFPGDMSLGAPAREIIQCRCSVFYEVDWIGQAESGPGRPRRRTPPDPTPSTPAAPRTRPATPPAARSAPNSTDPRIYREAGRQWMEENRVDFGEWSDDVQSTWLANIAAVRRLREGMAKEIDGGRRAKVEGSAKAKKWVGDASEKYPQSWVEASDNLGRVLATLDNRGRGSHAAFGQAQRNKPGTYRIKRMGRQHFDEGDAILTVPEEITTSVHEFGHRIQTALPELDEIFQSIHRRRTAGDDLVRLKSLFPHLNYRPSEVTRPDDYVDAYYGKEYGSEGAKEIFTMVFQSILGDRDMDAIKLGTKDRELLEIGIGLLLQWRP